MEYLHVKNLEKYHPGYKDRQLTWCKAYFTMVNADPAFEMLDEIDKWRFISFIMLELQIKKPVPLNETYLRRKGFDFKKRSKSLTLQMLHNLIEVRNAESDLSVPYIILEEDKYIEGKNKKSVTEKFKPPTPDEVTEYAKTLKPSYNLQGEKFCSYYQARGWMLNKVKMKDWRAAVRTWHGNEQAKKAPDAKPRPQAKCECGNPITMFDRNNRPAKHCYDCRKKLGE